MSSSENSGKNLAEDLEIIHHGLTSERDDRNVKMIAASKIRQLLVSDNNLLIQEILKRSWIPHLLRWLSEDQELHLQIGALWALTNIAAGPPEHTHTLIKFGAIGTLIELLSSENEEILEQSVWVLGNIAGEGPSSRDAVLMAGIFNCLSRHDSQPLLKIGAWTISNLCDGQSKKLGDITSLARLLSKLLLYTDPEILSHTCWSLSHLCDGPPTHLRILLRQVPNLCLTLVVLLSHRSWKIVKPALRTIGNIVCAEDEIDYTEMATEAGAVASLCNLVTHSNRDIQKEACWTLSNISAGTVSQIQKVIDSGILIHIVALARSKDTDPEVRSEASWVILNASSCGSDSQVEQLVHYGSVSVLNDMLSDSSMRLMALEGMERILAIGETKIRRNPKSDSLLTPNPFASLLSVEAIETLYNNTKSTALGKRVTKLYKDHFIACTICHKSFHKNTTVLKFCEECRGPVCHECDCSIYHLSYQEEVWDQIANDEAKKKKKKQKSKAKSKKVSKPAPKIIPPTIVEEQIAEPQVAPNSSQKNSERNPQVAPVFANIILPLATPISVDLEVDDESFIAVSRHKRKSDRDRGKHDEKKDHGKVPLTSKKTSPTLTSSLASKSKPPIKQERPSCTSIGETRNISHVTRYADAVLQSGTPNLIKSPVPSVTSIPAIADFPPLSATTSSKKGDAKTSGVSNSSQTSHSLADSQPTVTDFHDQLRPFSLTVCDSTSLSHLLTPTFDVSDPAIPSLSEIFLSPILLNSHDSGLHNDGLFQSSSTTASNLFSTNALSVDLDIEDGEVHMRSAEMLLGDDDDDKDLETSRETEDLVEFLQETGSIAALAEKLGIRK